MVKEYNPLNSGFNKVIISSILAGDERVKKNSLVQCQYTQKINSSSENYLSFQWSE